jgi:predicted TIM-barrel fold metal-dependent hydrolase
MAVIPFVDTHVHFWDRSVPELGGYSWLDPDGEPNPVLGPADAIKMPRYWADDFLAEVRFANVAKSIHVQAALGIEDPVEETRWLQAFADRLGHPHGIVAYADLAAADAEQTLDRHLEFANVRGIRDFRYDDYHSDPAWERGLKLLGARQLVLCDDPLLEQMQACAVVAARNPDITYCIDHAGFPKERGEAYFAEWAKGMRAIAAVPSTVVKISGLGMADHAWTVDSVRPWVLECIDAWSVDRAFFGTNWPLDRLFSSYGDVIDAYAEITACFSAPERTKLFRANAERIFRI